MVLLLNSHAIRFSRTIHHNTTPSQVESLHRCLYVSHILCSMAASADSQQLLKASEYVSLRLDSCGITLTSDVYDGLGYFVALTGTFFTTARYFSRIHFLYSHKLGEHLPIPRRRWCRSIIWVFLSFSFLGVTAVNLNHVFCIAPRWNMQPFGS